MPSDLERDLAHARAMAKAQHKPDCQLVRRDRVYPIRPNPACAGCVTDADRVLWRQIADELAAYRPILGANS